MRSLFLALTVVFLVLLYSFLHYNMHYNTQKHLEKETKQCKVLYNTIYKNLQSKSQLIFDLMIDKQQIKNIYKKINSLNKNNKEKNCNSQLIDLRNDLYKKIKNKYSKIQVNGKIPTIHFYTKDNLSFLNMKNPSGLCSDLTYIRPLLVKVNNIKKPIDGFEIGKDSSMYRFLFPIIENDVHLGSVEISYDNVIFINKFIGDSNLLAQILVSKEIIDKRVLRDTKFNSYYTNSPLRGMYAISELISNLEQKSHKSYTQVITSKATREKIAKIIKIKQEGFSIYDNINNDLITILPIINPATEITEGYFTTKHFSKYLQKQIHSLHNNFIIISFLITLIMFLAYKYLSSKMKRSKLLTQKNKELAKKQYELEKINTNLEQIVTEKMKENLKQSEVISKQSRIAALGEMMDAIAHQWKQPLNVIDMIINKLILKIDFNEKISTKDIIDLGEKTQLQIDHLVTTIDEFRTFFRPDKPTKRYKVKDLIDSTLQLEKDYLIKNQVELQTNIDEALECNCIKTEFIHILINIINNSIDAFNDNNLDKRLITICALKTDTHVKIEICDNAGGIQNEILPHIFKSNYTTKLTGKGTGIGLYLAKQIIEKIDGSIKAYNKNDGVCFKLLISK